MSTNTKKEELSLLDLVFLCDCTGSMGSYIASAQSSIKGIIEAITAANKVDMRVAVIGYEDHCDSKLLHEYDFTSNVDTANANVSKLYAGGGGDAPEAVEDAMKAALELQYREGATKIVIMVSDAPPHGLGQFNGDSYPDGCPLGVDPMAIARSMVENDIIVYSVGVEPTLTGQTFARHWFKTIASITGGRYVPLTNAASLPKVIIYGAEEEVELNKLAEQIQEEDKIVRDELAAKKEEKTDEEIFKMVTDRLAEKGVTVNTLEINSGSDEKAEPSEAEKEEERIVSVMTDLSTMAEVREFLKTCKAPTTGPFTWPTTATPSLPFTPIPVSDMPYAIPTTSYGFGPSPVPSSVPYASPAPVAYSTLPSFGYPTSSGYPSYPSSATPFGATVPTSAPLAPAAPTKAAEADLSSDLFFAAPSAPSAVPAAAYPSFGSSSAAPSAFGSAAPAPSSSSFGGPSSYSYAQTNSSINYEQVKRVMNRSNKSNKS